MVTKSICLYPMDTQCDVVFVVGTCWGPYITVFRLLDTHLLGIASATSLFFSHQAALHHRFAYRLDFPMPFFTLDRGGIYKQKTDKVLYY